ncbi:carboxypeptidase-like regulatory domain-containing protein [Sphingobacterium sp. JUb56]|uniref:carboxypeptidase-like regulatory domain-containing protein n=1 Tax=Sphingobacterium sp. JUb56 TaxID=2587145 RepID=UPI00161E129B|nr:carboxypeptidase-like regulatory domain-containing protein [Sphingobacterium sp. JUb56]MBB2954598.1 hypothetical protein [Sphingobacterium sp. JUb56]
MSFGQTDIRQFIDKLGNYAARNPKEKIHVHMDKESYSAGENIWMKLYCTLTPDNLLSGVSQVAYIDLISPDNKTVNTLKIPLTAGLGIADLALSDTLIEGSYRIRAYTQWMRNDSSAYFFDKTVPIYNGRSDNIMTGDEIIYDGEKKYYAIKLKTLSGVPLPEININYKTHLKNGKQRASREKTDQQGQLLIDLKDIPAGEIINLSFKSIDGIIIRKTFTVPADKSSNSLQILPESGNIINQLHTKIGFKALNSKGLGEKCTIIIMDSNKEKIVEMETSPLGMVSYPFVLDAKLKYTAIATFTDGTKTETPFPSISMSGLNMNVGNLTDDRVFVQVNASPDQINQQEIYLIAQYNGNTFHVSKQKLNKNEVLFSIPRQNLPQGVIQLSILDATLKPLLERMIFNYRSDKILPIEATADKPTYGTRQKVNISVLSGNTTDSIRVGSLSASVVNSNKTQIDTPYRSSIYTSLLLSSEINGFIENPNYYFSDSKNIKKSDLDNLMLIQGWRKLDWAKIDEVSDPKYNFEKNISISGTIKKLGRKAVVPKATVTLIPTTNMTAAIDTLTNEAGKFSFDDLLFTDSIKFIMTAKSDKDKNRLDIELDEIEEPATGINKNLPEVLNNINTKYLGNIKNAQAYFAQLEAAGLKQRSIQLEEVKITRTAIKKAVANSSNLNGPGNADQVLTEEDLSNCSTLEQCLVGRLTGVMWRNGVPYNTRGNGPMQVVLDGMYIEGDQISMLSAADVGSIEVLRNINHTAIYGSYGGNGLIVITTKRGNGATTAFKPTGIRTIIPKGFNLSRTFYKPSYEAKDVSKIVSDLRTTIHWEPNIITDQVGKASFDFYTSDEKGPYTIILEGIDFNGKIGRKEININVVE